MEAMDTNKLTGAYYIPHLPGLDNRPQQPWRELDKTSATQNKVTLYWRTLYYEIRINMYNVATMYTYRLTHVLYCSHDNVLYLLLHRHDGLDVC